MSIRLKDCFHTPRGELSYFAIERLLLCRPLTGAVPCDFKARTMLKPQRGLSSTDRRVSCCRFRGHRDRCFMEPKVGYGATEIYAGVQARGGEAGDGSWGDDRASVTRSRREWDSAATMGEGVRL